MKNCCYILFIFFFTFSVSGQKISVKQADILFAKKSYVKAAEMYEQLEQSQKVLQNLGDSYYNNFQMKNAVKAYAQLFFTYKDSLKPEYYFKYAHALMGVEDYDKGDAIMGEYLKYKVDTRKFIENLNRNLPYEYTIQTMAKNTTNGDFGIAFYGEKVAFASLRNAEKSAYGWNDKPYLDLYSANVNDK